VAAKLSLNFIQMGVFKLRAFEKVANRVVFMGAAGLAESLQNLLYR